MNHFRLGNAGLVPRLALALVPRLALIVRRHRTLLPWPLRAQVVCIVLECANSKRRHPLRRAVQQRVASTTEEEGR